MGTVKVMVMINGHGDGHGLGHGRGHAQYGIFQMWIDG